MSIIPNTNDDSVEFQRFRDVFLQVDYGYAPAISFQRTNFLYVVMKLYNIIHKSSKVKISVRNGCIWQFTQINFTPKKKKYSQFFLFPPKNIGNIFFLIFGKLKKKKKMNHREKWYKEVYQYLLRKMVLGIMDWENRLLS